MGAISFDLAVPTFRHEEYREYKPRAGGWKTISRTAPLRAPRLRAFHPLIDVAGFEPTTSSPPWPGGVEQGST